jgi:hypothetical protein
MELFQQFIRTRADGACMGMRRGGEMSGRLSRGWTRERDDGKTLLISKDCVEDFGCVMVLVFAQI